MKHLSFLNLILVFGLLSIFIISCEDEDNVAPTIRLLADKNGDIDKVYVVLNEDWQDPGYTADDNTDKDLLLFIRFLTLLVIKQKRKELLLLEMRCINLLENGKLKKL
ncbi:MAG: hypothetical protein B6I24_08255 [Bacteroidetes bacterium 4572_128]|nr:MAG: hypothetical protein B6I24_08255 [Bacteroidetes bacterium 4572_128]